MNRSRGTLALALFVDLLGAAGEQQHAGRDWQRVVVTRVRPLPDATANLTGRDLYAATTAFALIALAGVIAIAATRGWGRRLVGAVLVISAGFIVWYSIEGMSAVSPARARTSVASGVGVDNSSVAHVTVTAVWPVLTAASALLIALAGVLTAVFARRWSAMSARYEAPTDGAKAERGNADIAMWSALDRGDDPTTRTEP